MYLCLEGVVDVEQGVATVSHIVSRELIFDIAIPCVEEGLTGLT